MTKILAFLKGLPLTVYLVAGSLAVFGGWLALNNAHQREIGKRDIQIHQYEVANADLRAVADSLRKAYKVDTLRLTKLRRVTDSLTITVDRWKHDTLRVVEYVVRADSTIKVCTQALATCDQRVAVATRGWDGAREEIKVLKASMPSPAQKWLYGALGLGIGYGAGRAQK